MKREYLIVDELRPEIRDRIQWAERIIQGEYSENYSVLMEGIIYDMNDPFLTPAEIEFLTEWIYRKLGSAPGDASIQRAFWSPDRLTKIAILDVEITHGWYLSGWQTMEEKPIYYFLPQEFYDAKFTEDGYEEIEIK